ncbi:MAG: isochorismatase [Phycisphaerae bacterium]|nr:isochorismatase [Phycisphaerae bacterium]
MSIARLRIDHTAVLVIDVQERLLPTIVDRDRLVNNCSVLVRATQELGVPTLMTEQYVKGLGRTVDSLAHCLPNPAARIEKTRFSGLVELVDQQLKSWGTRSVLVCGLEAHVCVLQTVLDIQSSGLQAFVATDAISASNRDQIQPALSRMQASGAILTGVLSALYELMEDARHPAFRTCLELVKQIQP